MSSARSIARRESLRRAANFQVEGLERRVLLSSVITAVGAQQTAYALKTIDRFNANATGMSPYAVTMDASGNLFGLSSSGGAYGYGTVFELVHGSSVVTSIASFTEANAVNDYRSALLLDSTDDIFGTTLHTVFEIPHNRSSIVTLASTNDGGVAVYPRLAVYRDGNLYGTTFYGGGFGDGAIFELPQGSSTTITLASFNGANGADPNGLTADQNGNLFGTAEIGGANNLGTIAELAVGSSTIAALASFDGTTTGSGPASDVTFDGAGNLYGTTFGGGANSDGTVFELPRGSTSIVALAAFSGFHAGGNPVAMVAFDGSGNLFGTASPPEQGFPSSPPGNSYIFELPSGSSSIITLATFTGLAINGVLDGAGDVFSTISSGGANGTGSVIEIPHGTSTVSTLVSFDPLNAIAPSSRLGMDGLGNLYGITDSGVYEIPHTTSKIATVAYFSGSNGDAPECDPLIDSSGNLFGTTVYGAPAAQAIYSSWQRTVRRSIQSRPSAPAMGFNILGERWLLMPAGISSVLRVRAAWSAMARFLN